MTETAIILSIGEIELEADDDAPLEAILTLPAILQDGSELVLKFGTRDMLQLWETLSAIRALKPAIFGIQ